MVLGHAVPALLVQVAHRFRVLDFGPALPLAHRTQTHNSLEKVNLYIFVLLRGHR